MITNLVYTVISLRLNLSFIFGILRILISYLSNIHIFSFILFLIYSCLIFQCSTIKVHNTSRSLPIKVLLGKIDSHGHGSENVRRVFQEGLFIGLQERGIQWEEFRNSSEIPPPLPFEATSLFLFRNSPGIKENLLTASEIKNLSLKTDSEYFIQGVLHYFRDKNPEELLISLRLYNSTGELQQTLTLTQKIYDYEKIQSLGSEISASLGKGIFP